jgi:hypothetical protein
VTRRTLSDLIDTYEEIATAAPESWWEAEDHTTKNVFIDVVRDLKAIQSAL